MHFQDILQPQDAYNETLQSHVHPADWENPVHSGRYNLVIIGAGTAGLVTAAGAAGLGAKVALIERSLMGGDCLNVGCVPSKALIAAARRAAGFRGTQPFGIEEASPHVDFPAVMQRMRRLRAGISPHDSAARFRELGVDVYFGQGKFISGDAVAVGDRTLSFAKAVIATGTRATVPPIPGLLDAGYHTHESLFTLTQLPKRLIVIGGGAIGCEMAQAFARFGSQVTLIESSPQILAREDKDAASLVQQAMQNDGVDVILRAKVNQVERQGREIRVNLSQDGQESAIMGDEILIATGRTPNVDGLGLEVGGIAFDPRQGVQVNDRLQTTNRKVYAAGDICSRYKFTHAADFLARTVIQNALFMGRAKASQLVIPWCTYTSPEVAHVGISLAEAADRGIELSTFHQPLVQVDRALLDGEEDGFIRIHCKKGSDRILGATIVSAHAGEMIGAIVMAMKHRIGLGKIASVIHPYPTQAEAIRKLGDQFNRTRLTPTVKSLFKAWLKWTR